MKKIMSFIVSAILANLGTLAQGQSSTFSFPVYHVNPKEHNILVKAVMLNYKKILSDKDFLQAVKRNQFLSFLSTKDYIPSSIRSKLSNVPNFTSQSLDTISKKDYRYYIALLKAINSSSDLSTKQKILNGYTNRFASQKLNNGVRYAKDILAEGSLDIYNPTFYIQQGLFPGINPTAVQRGVDNMAADDVKGAISGAIVGSIIPTGVTTVACGAVGGAAASVASGVWEIISYFSDTPEEDGVPLGPIMQEGIDALQNAVEQSSTCTAGEGGVNETRWSQIG